MYKVNEEKESISFKISSELRLTDRVAQDAGEFLKQFEISELANFNTALRELLNNAIEHGNKNNVDKEVSCRLERLKNSRFKIVVEDQGAGFDYQKLQLTLPKDPMEPRSRGYGLVNAFSDFLEFNQKGNQVTAYFNFPKETSFDITDENGWKVITPTGDVTAAKADNFREILIKLLDEGCVKFKFDLNHAEDIDSVSLSVFILFAKMLLKQNSRAELMIINANKDLMNLFRMTRMDKTYKISGK